MDPFEFEEYVAKHLKSQWYTKVKVTQAIKDWWSDIHAKKDGKVYIIQCKRYNEKTKIPVGEVRAISWVAKQLWEDHIGMIITTWFLTKNAVQEAIDYGVVVRDASNIVEKLGLE